MSAEFILKPDPHNQSLLRYVDGVDENGTAKRIAVVEERPLTIFLNSQEIVTAMTVGDYPDLLGVGYLRNQGMLLADDVIEAIDYDADLETVVVRTTRKTNYEEKLKKKIRTSGCAIGTVFGDMMEQIEGITLPDLKLREDWLFALSKTINTTPSLYLEAGAIHGTVLCHQDKPLVYMEDVGRHNAVDKVTGWMVMNNATAADKILYTTGRLTSEMVIKCVLMGIPALVSRSGFTGWGVELAQSAGLTLIGRMRGTRYICLSGNSRLERSDTSQTQASGAVGAVS